MKINVSLQSGNIGMALMEGKFRDAQGVVFDRKYSPGSSGWVAVDITQALEVEKSSRVTLYKNVKTGKVYTSAEYHAFAQALLKAHTVESSDDEYEFISRQDRDMYEAAVAEFTSEPQTQTTWEPVEFVVVAYQPVTDEPYLIPMQTLVTDGVHTLYTYNANFHFFSELEKQLTSAGWKVFNDKSAKVAGDAPYIVTNQEFSKVRITPFEQETYLSSLGFDVKIASNRHSVTVGIALEAAIAARDSVQAHVDKLVKALLSMVKPVDSVTRQQLLEQLRMIERNVNEASFKASSSPSRNLIMSSIATMHNMLSE